MIDIVDRTPDPDIPETSKDLLLRLFKQKYFKSISRIEAFRATFPIDQQGKNLADFMDSAAFRAHVKNMEDIVASKRILLEEHAHDAVLAEQRKAEKITAQATETQDAIGAVVEEAGI